jgi:hypothetical protein
MVETVRMLMDVMERVTKKRGSSSSSSIYPAGRHTVPTGRQRVRHAGVCREAVQLIKAFAQRIRLYAEAVHRVRPYMTGRTACWLPRWSTDEQVPGNVGVDTATMCANPRPAFTALTTISRSSIHPANRGRGLRRSSMWSGRSARTMTNSLSSAVCRRRRSGHHGAARYRRSQSGHGRQL